MNKATNQPHNSDSTHFFHHYQYAHALTEKKVKENRSQQFSTLLQNKCTVTPEEKKITPYYKTVKLVKSSKKLIKKYMIHKTS